MSNTDYSRDADQTRYIRYFFYLCCGIMAMLGIIEIVNILVPSETGFKIFSNELNHVLVNGSLLGFVGIGAYVFGKNQGLAEAEMNRQREQESMAAPSSRKLKIKRFQPPED